MRMLRLEKSESAAGVPSVMCAGCGDSRRWNQAADEGWRSDPDGKEYYCPSCAGKVVHCVRDCADV